MPAKTFVRIFGSVLTVLCLAVTVMFCDLIQVVTSESRPLSTLIVLLVLLVASVALTIHVSLLTYREFRDHS